jgi:trans-aconitate 2-methyltransferase
MGRCAGSGVDGLQKRDAGGMERIVEPELMDDVLQARAYAAADFSATDQAVLERIDFLFGAALQVTDRCLRIVDLGCGPGNITFLLARRWPAAAVVGIDGAAAMLAIATQRCQSAPEAFRHVRFCQAVLPCPQRVEERYHALVSNSLLHHLHDPGVLWQSVRQLALPGASLYIKDLRRPANATALQELVLRHAGTAPAVLRRDYAHSLRAAFTTEEVAGQLELAGLDRLQVQDLDDRYLEIFGFLP